MNNDYLEGFIDDFLKPAHLAATFLDHRYQSNNLNQNHQRLVFDFLADVFNDPEISGQIADYINKTGEFRRLFLKETLEPKKFWASAAVYYKELSLFASHVLDVPAFLPNLDLAKILSIISKYGAGAIEPIAHLEISMLIGEK